MSEKRLKERIKEIKKQLKDHERHLKLINKYGAEPGEEDSLILLIDTLETDFKMFESIYKKQNV